jgi:hypothetical protein
MHAASRDSMQVVQRRFDDVVGNVDTAELSGFADELASLAGLLVEHSVLRKYLAAREDDSTPKVR